MQLNAKKHSLQTVLSNSFDFEYAYCRLYFNKPNHNEAAHLPRLHPVTTNRSVAYSGNYDDDNISNNKPKFIYAAQNIRKK